MADETVVEGPVLADAELITAVRGGDADAFGVLFARHSAAATAVARRYLPEADADDVVAGAFEKVLEVLRAGKGPDVAFRAYLFTVVRRRAVESLERGRRAAPTDDDRVFETAVGPLASSEDPALRGFEDRTVARAFQALPERWRSVLWYTDIEGLSPAEVAPALGMTPNAVSALAYRAREGLRQAYLQAHLADVADDDACARTNAQLGAYVRGGLARREAARVEEHLEGCARCRAVALELGDLAAGMRATVAPLVVGLVGVAALGGLPLVLAGAGGAGGVASAGASSDGPSGSSSGAGRAGRAGAGAAAAAAAVAAASGARAGGRWLVGVAAGVAGLLVVGALALGAGWFDGGAPPVASPPPATAPAPQASAPQPSASSGVVPTPSPDATPSVPATVPPTVPPSAPPTTAPAVARPGQPTESPTVRPTTAPTAAPTTAPTESPSTAPTDGPTTPPPAAPPPVVTRGAGTVLVAGGTGVLDLVVERPTALAVPATLTVTLPDGATWDGAALDPSSPGASSWVCATSSASVLGCRTPADATPPAARKVTRVASGGTRGGAAPRTVTTADELRFAVRLDASTLDPGAVRIETAAGGASATTSVDLGRAASASLTAAGDGADGIVLSASSAGPSAARPLSIDVRNVGRALDAATVSFTVPNGLEVTGAGCVASSSDGPTSVTCELGALAAGAASSHVLDVAARAGAPLALTTLPVTLDARVGAARLTARDDVPVRVDTDRFSLLAHLVGPYRLETVGAPMIHCAPGSTACLDIAAAGGDNNNLNGSAQRVVLDGSTPALTSAADLVVPAGARVVDAYVTWSAQGPSAGALGDPAALPWGTLTDPSGTAHRVHGESRLASEVGATLTGTSDHYQTVARIAPELAAQWTGTWSFVSDALPRTNAGYFAGWSLVVVLEDASWPENDVRVYGGFDVVSGTDDLAVGFALDDDATVRVTATAWEGDRSLAGDHVTLAGEQVPPATPGADPLNVFDSSVAGWRAPAGSGGNSFGVDVTPFEPVGLAAGAHELRFVSGTGGDAFVVSTFSLELTTR